MEIIQNNAPAVNFEPFMLVKPRRETSPIALHPSDLPEWEAGIGGIERSAGTYVGSHIFPPDCGLKRWQEVPDDLDLKAVPCHYHFRMEADGDGPFPLRDACLRMKQILDALARLPGLALFRDGQWNKHFRFFSTGQRSIYAVATSMSSEALTGWDCAARALMMDARAVVGDGFADTQIYATPKAPARAYFTRHEAGTWFNPIPLEWVLDSDWLRIGHACEQPVVENWAPALIDVVGMARMVGGALYEALKALAERERFLEEARLGCMLDRLPIGHRPDYLGLLEGKGFRVMKSKKRNTTLYFLLDRCPYCGRSEGHAQLSELGRLRCFAGSCSASREGGVPALGDEGWLRHLGLQLADPEEEGDDEPNDLDLYPEAADLSQAIGIHEARQAISMSLHRFLRTEP